MSDSLGPNYARARLWDRLGGRETNMAESKVKCSGVEKAKTAKGKVTMKEKKTWKCEAKGRGCACGYFTAFIAVVPL